MMHYLIVKDGVIVNHHVGGHPSWEPPEGHIEVEYDGDFDIGWHWNGVKAINPNPAPPVQTRVDSQPIDGEVL